MTEKEIKEFMGKQYSFSDALMSDYKEQIFCGKLDVYSLESILDKYDDFSLLVKKPRGYSDFYLNNEACFLLKNTFSVVDAFTGNIRGSCINPVEDCITMVSNNVVQVTYETNVNGIEEYIININLNSVHIVPFISIYCAMASLSRFINTKNKVSKIVLSDGKVLLTSSMIVNWELVKKGIVKVKDTDDNMVHFSILDIEGISRM